jgi:hypothetical protein
MLHHSENVMTLRDQLLHDATRFCEEKGMSKARLATIVVNDGKFFDRVEAGGGFTTRTYEKFQAHFAAQASAA